MGVDTGGAGDQGLMFGYACDETPELMPMTIMLAHKLTRKLSEVRKNGTLPYLRPDGKSQVTIEYVNGKPHKIHTVVVSSQHGPDVDQKQIRQDIIEKVIKPVLPKELVDDKIIYHINPTGQFIVGGPMGDTGLTGSKIIVDTYGGVGSHGGGAFSGKDPSKVDRSASYMARYVAKNIVAAGIATECEVQLAYAIGVPEPVSIHVDDFGTGKVSHEKLVETHQEELRHDAEGHHQDPRPQASDLQEDRGLRPLRPDRARVHLGEDGQGRGAQEGRGTVRQRRRSGTQEH